HLRAWGDTRGDHELLGGGTFRTCAIYIIRPIGETKQITVMFGPVALTRAYTTWVYNKKIYQPNKNKN
ncbi:hypothetical protein, partial [Enterobacter hormaechei]